MGIYRAHLAKRLQGLAKWLCLPVVLLGYTMDTVANVTLATLIFLDLPKEWLVTDRLIRYKKEQGWRLKVAQYICEELLDPFDPTGDHC